MTKETAIQLFEQKQICVILNKLQKRTLHR